MLDLVNYCVFYERQVLAHNFNHLEIHGQNILKYLEKSLGIWEKIDDRLLCLSKETFRPCPSGELKE